MNTEVTTTHCQLKGIKSNEKMENESRWQEEEEKKIRNTTKIQMESPNDDLMKNDALSEQRWRRRRRRRRQR